jgi:hypothetical protein
MNYKQFQQVLTKTFGSREGHLAWQLAELSSTGQPCDITFYKREPMLDVKIDQRLFLALSYGAGAKKLAELLNNLKLTNGESISWGEIWTVNPMPKDGFTEAELRAVDLAQAEEKVGPNGETLRQMIRDTYHCTTKEEEDKYLRRFIAS